MIGMIALAGIIVRNSILLVDFIDNEIRAGTPRACRGTASSHGGAIFLKNIGGKGGNRTLDPGIMSAVL